MAAMNVSSFAFQAMILAREMAALSVSVIPLYVLLQRFCTVMSSCNHSISCGENAVSVSAWCTASHRTVVVKCSTGSSFSFQAMILALNCRRNACLERLKPDAPDPALLSEMFFVAER